MSAAKAARGIERSAVMKILFWPRMNADFERQASGVCIRVYLRSSAANILSLHDLRNRNRAATVVFRSQRSGIFGLMIDFRFEERLEVFPRHRSVDPASVDKKRGSGID